MRKTLHGVAGLAALLMLGSTALATEVLSEDELDAVVGGDYYNTNLLGAIVNDHGKRNRGDGWVAANQSHHVDNQGTISEGSHGNSNVARDSGRIVDERIQSSSSKGDRGEGRSQVTISNHGRSSAGRAEPGVGGTPVEQPADLDRLPYGDPADPTHPTKPVPGSAASHQHRSSSTTTVTETTLHSDHSATTVSAAGSGASSGYGSSASHAATNGEGDAKVDNDLDLNDVSQQYVDAINLIAAMGPVGTAVGVSSNVNSGGVSVDNVEGGGSIATGATNSSFSNVGAVSRTGDVGVGGGIDPIGITDIIKSGI